MTRKTTSLWLIAGVIAVTGSAIAAQAKRPDFAGTWRQDTDASKALTEKMGEVWRVAGAGAGGASPSGASATPPPGAVVMSPITKITQSDKELVIERSYEGEIINHDVYKLDGTVSVNASRNSSSRSTTTWKGSSLVTSDTIHFEFNQAATADGKPITEITRQFVTTRTLMPDGSMQIESRTTQDGKERVQWTVMVRVKPS